MRCNPLVCSLLAASLGLVGVACSDDDGGNNNQNHTPVCGNGTVEFGEDCEGSNLNGDTCVTLGMQGTGLACTASCTFDTSACQGCGNGTIELSEECDGADVGSQTCANSGFTAGELGCQTDCTLDYSSCTGGCGNGVVEAGEECDPPNGTTCDSTCNLAGGDECDEPDTYDTDCASATSGQWCWDGGDGGSLFCGCDADYGNEDCQTAGYEYCNPSTQRCEAPPVCGTDANEDNDTEATATALTPGTPANGATCGFDPDWFVFTAGDTAAEVVIAWTDDSETDLDVDITDCAGTSIGDGYSSEAAEEVVSLRDLTAGTDYCILVDHYSGAAGGADVSYAITVTDAHTCALDTDCTAGQYCPFGGPGAGVCQPTAPAGAGCGDAVAGDNETSGQAEVLTSGTPITEGTCDGHPTGPADVDWFTFTLAAGERLDLTVTQAGALTAGDVDLVLYDAAGEVWAASATTNNPETISGAGLPAGSYYAVVFYYDNDTAVAAADDYTIALTISSGTGCADRDDCANFSGRGECTSGLCVAFDGAGTQGAGEFCDSADDCSPATGSDWSSSPCFMADRNLGTDNVCVIDCTQESDCTTYGMHCYLVDATSTPPGICLSPCTSDAGCGGGVCNTGTGICENAP